MEDPFFIRFHLVEILLVKEYEDRGLIPPFREGEWKKDFSRALQQMSGEDARRVKRKFRKIWRQLAGLKHPRIYGNMSDTPTRSQKMNRKKIVWSELQNEAIKKERGT